MQHKNMLMKRFLPILCAIVLSVAPVGAKNPAKNAVKAALPASSEKITFIGRTLPVDGAVSFDWSGVTAVVCFSGTFLELDYEATGDNYVNVWTDMEPAATGADVIRLKDGGKAVMVSGLKKGRHTVTIQKRNEGRQGRLTFKGLCTDGEFLQARSLKDRKIEAIGDSYTCGYGTEGKDRSEGFKVETENCNLTYAAIIGRFFNADVAYVSHSGQGVARNYGGASPECTMVHRYLRTFDEAVEPIWKVSPSFIPDIVLIYLGTNDFSTKQQPILGKWSSDYKTLLQEVRSNYGGSVPILCIASKVDDLLAEYVKRAVLDSDIPNVYWTAIHDQAHDITSELGSGWHPNYKGHRKVATCIIPYISTITGWEMPFTPVE